MFVYMWNWVSYKLKCHHTHRRTYTTQYIYNCNGFWLFLSISLGFFSWCIREKRPTTLILCSLSRSLSVDLSAHYEFKCMSVYFYLCLSIHFLSCWSRHCFHSRCLPLFRHIEIYMVILTVARVSQYRQSYFAHNFFFVETVCYSLCVWPKKVWSVCVHLFVDTYF